MWYQVETSVTIIYLNFQCYLVHPWEYQGTAQTEKFFHLKTKKEIRNTKNTYMKGKMETETGDVGIW